MNPSYITIISGKLHFLIPVLWVSHIEDGANQETDLPVLALSDLTGIQPAPGTQQYRILLSHNGKTMELLAENVSAMKEVSNREIIKLREPVLNEKNRYLHGAVLMETATGNGTTLAYLLDPEALYERALDDQN